MVDGGRIGSGMKVSLVLAIWMMRKLEKGSFGKVLAYRMLGFDTI